MAPKTITRPCSHCGGTGRELDPKAIGDQMRQLRKRSKKSLREVADKMGFVAPYISDLERGNRAFSEEMVEKFKEALK